LSWTHIKALIYIDDPLKREFYVEMCKAERWSTRTLQDRLDSMLFERTALSRKPDELLVTELAALRTTGHPSLSTLYAKARKEKLITNAGLRANERLARKRADYRASMEHIREMEERGLSEMRVDDFAIEPLPKDYAHDSLKIFAETLPFFRNTYAHGSAMLHSTVLGTFEIVTDLVNQLYPVDLLSKA